MATSGMIGSCVELRELGAARPEGCRDVLTDCEKWREPRRNSLELVWPVMSDSILGRLVKCSWIKMKLHNLEGPCFSHYSMRIYGKQASEHCT